MSDVIERVHDKLFKETFGHTEIAIDFMNGYLPEKIEEIEQSLMSLK